MSRAEDHHSIRASTLQAHRSRIARVAHYLREHADETIDFAALARMAGLSARQLDRIFTRTVGETPSSYLRQLRLERAARRLRSSRVSILNVALDAGFESHEAFTRGFRQRFGHTPAGYRALVKVTARPCARRLAWRLIASELRQHIEKNGPART